MRSSCSHVSARAAARSLACGALLCGCAAPQDPAPAPDARHVGPVTALCALGDRVASCSQAGIAWSLDGPVRAAPFRPFALAAGAEEGTLLAAGGDPARRGEVALLAGDRVRARRTLGKDLVYALARAPEGTCVAAGVADGSVHLLALPDLQPQQTLRDHGAPVRALAFSADGSLLFSAGLDGVVVRRDLARGDVLRIVDHTAPVECLALAPGGERIVSGARDGKVRIHGTDGRLRRTLARLGAEVLAVAWEDERTVLAGLGDGRVLALRDEGEGERHLRARCAGPVFALLVADGRTFAASEGAVVSCEADPRRR